MTGLNLIGYIIKSGFFYDKWLKIKVISDKNNLHFRVNEDQ